MSHFAHINPQKVVEKVIVAEETCQEIENDPENWIQTSYNTEANIHLSPITGLPDDIPPFGMNYASIGGSWDGTGFKAPQPFPSWILNTSTYQWESPIPYPTDCSQ